MITLAEIVIGLIFSTVAMHVVTCTWMVWGIERQITRQLQIDLQPEGDK